VVKGRATFAVDGEAIDAPAGTVVFVHDPAAKRGAVAEEDGTTVLAVGGRPGEAFTPSTWERSAPALAFFATQEYRKAAEALREAHEEFPDDPTVLYNLACAQSLLGWADEAIDHLGQSIAIDESFRELAQTDSDFDPIRDDPRFKELVG
jgi:tetratricopeptide (TPR) repeat protein